MLRTLARSIKRSVVAKLRHYMIEAESREWQERKSLLVSNLRSCGESFTICEPFRVHGPGQITIGRNVHIGENCFLRGEGGITIGNNTVISRNLVLYSINHRYEGNLVPYDRELVKKPVVIGNNVWIGMNVCIAPGTVIEDGAIIGLGAVVSGRIGRCEIVGLPPTRILKHRDEDRYARLVAESRIADPWGFPFGDETSASSAEYPDDIL